VLWVEVGEDAIVLQGGVYVATSLAGRGNAKSFWGGGKISWCREKGLQGNLNDGGNRGCIGLIANVGLDRLDEFIR
jgi:hypothetical protein